MNKAVSEQQNKPQLSRDIKFWGASFISLNSMIGAGIFALPAAIAVNAGIFSPWLFLLVGALFTTIVLVFAELASHFKETGGPVLYATETFGPLTGFNTGWLLFLSRMTAGAANTTVMVIYLGKIFPYFADGVGRALFITVLIAWLTYANVRGVKDGVRTIGLFSIFKLTPLILMILLGLPFVTPENLLPTNMPTVDDFGGTALLIIYAFVGFEAASFTAGETKDASKTLPKALITTIIGTAFLYFMIMLVFTAVLPDADKNSTLTDVGQVLAGSTGALALALAAVFSIGGNLAANMISVPRLTFALAEHNLLPKWFGHVHATHATPDKSVLFLGVLMLAFALSGSFAALAVASSLSRLIAYGICAAAIPVVRKRSAEMGLEAGFRLPLGLTIPAIALGLCVWMAAQASQQAWITIGVLLAIGLFLYWLETRNNAKA